MRLSIVLPAFNEAKRVGSTLQELVEYRSACGHQLDVIVVDDGSTDTTGDVARSFAEHLPEFRVITLPSNRGKGRAVATGMLAATGEYRAFFDADGATPIAEVEKLLDAIRSTPRSVAIGSIRVEGTSIVRRQPLHRTLAGRLGNAFIRATVLPGVADSQRGCKLFSAELADTVFGAQKTDGWGFDIEVLALSQALGYQVLEVAVDWTHVEGGNLRAGAYVSTLAEVVRIRRLLRSGAHQLEGLGPRPRTGFRLAKRKTA